MDSQITEHQVYIEEISRGGDFDDLTITGDSDYDILEEKHYIISLHNIVWVKVTKVIWQSKLLQVPLSDRK